MNNKKNSTTTTTTTTATAITSSEPTSIRSQRLPDVRMIQNFFLVWLDSSIDLEDNTDSNHNISKLKEVVNTVNMFTNVDECLNFISNHRQDKIFMIVSDILRQTTVPIVHDMPQVSKIYIFCGNQTSHEQWTNWPKIKGIFTDIAPICEALQKAAQKCDRNMISISFVKKNCETTKQNLDQLDSSFMYTQIMKEILLTIDFNQQHIDEFTACCRQLFAANPKALQSVEKFEQEYHKHYPIWWYTYPGFLYSMLNRSLRMMEFDLIIPIGFFIRDLYNNVAELHAQQYIEHASMSSLTVYRGQGLLHSDFNQMAQTQGGLLSFNNFLSTSLDRKVSLAFAESNKNDPDLTGILFQITINPSTSTTAFANLHDVSYYKDEEEILFSMHSIFRIGLMEQIDGNNRLWQVDLILTNDNDPDLHALTEQMREETKGSIGWLRLGKLLIKLAQYKKAEDLCGILLDQTTNDEETGNVFFQLGLIKLRQGKYSEALTFYEKSLEIRQKNLSPQHPDVAECYNDIGLLYKKMDQYSEALSYYQKALKIRQDILPPNYPDLAESYNNIGALYKKLGDNQSALSYYNKALEIDQETLPAYHPSLATSYNNIGTVYSQMGDYPKALSYYQKDLEICQRTLPSNHHYLATSYNNIGWAYRRMGNYQMALKFYEHALDIKQSSLPPDDPSLQSLRKNIETVKEAL